MPFIVETGGRINALAGLEFFDKVSGALEAGRPGARRCTRSWPGWSSSRATCWRRLLWRSTRLILRRGMWVMLGWLRALMTMMFCLGLFTANQR